MPTDDPTKLRSYSWFNGKEYYNFSRRANIRALGISLGEQYMKPTTMLFRNLMAMDVEESIRANPVDGVVLLAGCDKTTPAMLMGAASADVPAMIITGGPTLSGNYQGRTIGQGTDGRKIFD